MNPVRSILLGCISALFVAAGLFLLVRGEPTQRTLAYGVIVFFGACAVVALMQFAPRERVKLDDDGGLTLWPDKIQAMGLVVGSAGLAIGCFLSAPLAKADGEGFVSIIGYVGVAFFGLGVPLAAWRLFRPNALARIDSEGVRTFGLGAWSLDWHEVDAIHELNVSGQAFIAFETKHRNLMHDMPRFALNLSLTRLAVGPFHALSIELWSNKRRTSL
ncbi:MAG: STM3941 family protein [Terricaulis sp.]